MNASPTQSVREALQVFRLAEIRMESPAVDSAGNLVYAKASTSTIHGAKSSDSEAICVLVAKIECELARYANDMDTVRERLIPQVLPSLARLQAPNPHGRLEAINGLTTEWNTFLKANDVAAHREWEQTLQRREHFLDNINQGMPLGLICSAEDGDIAAKTLSLTPERVEQLRLLLTRSPYNQINEQLGISEQTIKDARRSPSLRLVADGSHDSNPSPWISELKFPQPQALRDSLQSLYEQQYEPRNTTANSSGTSPPVGNGEKANFIKFVSLLVNQTALNLLDEMQGLSMSATANAVIFNKADTHEHTQIYFDGHGNVIVDRTRWEKWTAFIHPRMSTATVRLLQNGHRDDPLSDTNCNYRSTISLKLRREDIARGEFRPDITTAPTFSACIALDWKRIDPVLKSYSKGPQIQILSGNPGGSQRI